MNLSQAEFKVTPEGRPEICDIVIINDNPAIRCEHNEDLITFMIRNIDYICPTLDIRVYAANPGTFAYSTEIRRKIFPWHQERESKVIAGARVLIEFDFPGTDSQRVKERILQARRSNIEVLIQAGSQLKDLEKEYNIPSFSCGNGLLALLEHRLGRQRRFSFASTPNPQNATSSETHRLKNLRTGLILALIGKGGTDLFMPFFEVYSNDYHKNLRQLAVVGTLEAPLYDELTAELSKIGFPDVLLLGNASESELQELCKKAFAIVVLGTYEPLPNLAYQDKNLVKISQFLEEPEKNRRFQQVFLKMS